MPDEVALLEYQAQMLDRGLSVVHRPLTIDHDMGGHAHSASADWPQVNVMDIADARLLHQSIDDVAGRDPARRAVEQQL